MYATGLHKNNVLLSVWNVGQMADDKAEWMTIKYKARKEIEIKTQTHARRTIVSVDKATKSLLEYVICMNNNHLAWIMRF